MLSFNGGLVGETVMPGPNLTLSPWMATAFVVRVSEHKPEAVAAGRSERTGHCPVKHNKAEQAKLDAENCWSVCARSWRVLVSGGLKR